MFTTVTRNKRARLFTLVVSSSTIALTAAQAQEAQDANGIEQVVVIGTGETRTVSTLLPQNQVVLPPGASVQKSLNFLPGVMAQSIDPLGANEQSLTLQVRGFSTTHLGYTLDGMPLGDGAYNNYNGLTISRALISENLGRADLATGIGGLSVASTSNLGGAVTYTSSAPKEEFGAVATQTFGSYDGKRSFVRVDSGEHDGFSAYLSGQYEEGDLFINQGTYKTSYAKQLNGKAEYKFDNGKITAFMDLSRTNQADDPYLSKDQLSRLGFDYGGYAPDWTDYVKRAACSVTSLAAQCVAATAPEKNADVTFTNGSILRNDDLFYVAGDYAFSDALTARLQVYRHTDKGAGNNFIAGLSNQGTTTTADDVPVQIRDTRYTINRDGIVGSLAYDLDVAGIHNHAQAGFWVEENTSSAARYIHTDVTGPSDLSLFLTSVPSTAQWVQQTQWATQQFYVQDTVSLLDDALTIDFGFKGTHAKDNAKALPGISTTPPPATSQFANGTLTARDFFLPEVGANWKIAPGHEVYASYSENMAMFQGGFKLGPQSVIQSIWDAQGSTLVPETSRSFDFGYRFVTDGLQLSLAGYHVNFEHRLLQYNPCPTALAANPGCNNSFHNAGSVTSNGAELGVQWQIYSWLNWYNSASYDATTYDSDLNFCTATCTVFATTGKQQVDTPKQLFSSVTMRHDGWWASAALKFTGRRYYTYTNDQSFGAYTTLDAGAGYDFGSFGWFEGAKLALNVTNLTGLRYASNFDNSVFAPNDPTGTIVVAHAAAPREFFLTFGANL